MKNIEIVPQTNNAQVVYRYGVRVHSESIPEIETQIQKSRALYNNIIAVTRKIYTEMQDFVYEYLDENGKNLQDTILKLNADFKAAKQDNNEELMKEIAIERKKTWQEFSEILKAIRKEHREILIEKFYSRIGNNTSTETYACRKEAVLNGLGQSTATYILTAALTAWNTSMKKGRPPKFMRSEDKNIDKISLQFSMKGGLPIEEIFTGKRQDMYIAYPKHGFKPRSYSPFIFRVGAASANTFVEGTIQLHRNFPVNSRIAFVHLIRRKIGPNHKYEMQFTLNLETPLKLEPLNRRKPLVALHMGWSKDEEGRRLAGIADSDNPLKSRILILPDSIENDLNEASLLQGKRDLYRNEIFSQLKEYFNQSDLEILDDPDFNLQWDKIKRLPIEYISANKLHFIVDLMKNKNEVIPGWLETWDSVDKRMWTQAVGLSKCARNRRKKYYEKIAIDLASQYEAILIDMPNMKKSATKVNLLTGEKNSLNRKARNGRVVASLSTLEAAIQWAACKYGSAVFSLKGEKTVSKCCYCSSEEIEESTEDEQQLFCNECGSIIDRKINGAVNAWNIAAFDLEALTIQYWETTRMKIETQAENKKNKMSKMLEKRKQRKLEKII